MGHDIILNAVKSSETLCLGLKLFKTTRLCFFGVILGITEMKKKSPVFISICYGNVRYQNMSFPVSDMTNYPNRADMFSLHPLSTRFSIHCTVDKNMII